MFQLVTGSCVERETLKFAQCQGWHQPETFLGTLAKLRNSASATKKSKFAHLAESEQQFNKRTYGE